MTRTLAISTLALLLVMPLILLLAIPHTNAHNFYGHSGKIRVRINQAAPPNAQCYEIDLIVDVDVDTDGEQEFFIVGLYRAHATAIGRQNQQAIGYNIYTDITAEWEEHARYLATVDRATNTEPQDYVRTQLQDCPSQNTIGYRYVGYLIERHNPSWGDHTHFTLDTSDIYKVALPSTTTLTPNFYTHTSTADRILFTYYTYQFADTLKAHRRLRETLLGALFPNATDRELLDAIDSDLQWKTPDDE